MIIGILEADILDDEVIEQYGRYADSFEQLLSAIDPQLDFQTYHVARHEYPRDINECDAYLITGSKSSCYEDVDWIHRLKQFVVHCHQQEIKMVGICFGHQLIADALGGAVQKSDKGWGIGVASTDIMDEPAWLEPKQKQFSLLVSHQDQVTRLPRQAALVATNAFCPISAYSVNNSVLAFQGHPEFSRDYLQYIMTHRREYIGEKAYQHARETLHQNEDSQLVAQWIVNFIRS